MLQDKVFYRKYGDEGWPLYEAMNALYQRKEPERGVHVYNPTILPVGNTVPPMRDSGHNMNNDEDDDLGEEGDWQDQPGYECDVQIPTDARVPATTLQPVSRQNA